MASLPPPTETSPDQSPVETPSEKRPPTLERRASLFQSKVQVLVDCAAEVDQDCGECDYVITKIRKHRVPALADYLGPDQLQWADNQFFRTKLGKPQPKAYLREVDDAQIVIADIVRDDRSGSEAHAFLRAGPRRSVCWRPDEVKAAIVTCGGLCPGLNTVVSELVNTLHYVYSVAEIYGIKYGFRGFYESSPVKLTPDGLPEGLYCSGGTWLGTSRGGFDEKKIVNAWKEHGFNQIYIIGGDGTHRGADALAAAVRKQGLKIAVVGIPKTIDNDISLIDRSFGFTTAVEEAVKAVESIRVEAKSAMNGVGLVKLMGRHAGFVASWATLAHNDVNLCLIPEIAFDVPLMLEYIEECVTKRGYCVVVVAEGAGQDIMRGDAARDLSGNSALQDIGDYLKKEIARHFAEKQKLLTLKYNCPAYMVRSVPPNAYDIGLCFILAKNAVHGAMAGLTGFVSAMVNNRTVYIPIALINQSSPTQMHPYGRTWERITASTQQPHFPGKIKHEYDSSALAATVHANPAPSTY